MSKFLLDAEDDTDDNNAKAIAIPRVFSENSRANTRACLGNGYSNISWQIVLFELTF